MPLIPPALIGITAPILDHRYTHKELDSLFMSAGFPGDPPVGNKTQKCLAWMRAANSYLQSGTSPLFDPLPAYGRLMAEFMDIPPAEAHSHSWAQPVEPAADPRDRIHEALGREGLSYGRGGHILGAALTGPSR